MDWQKVRIGKLIEAQQGPEFQWALLLFQNVVGAEVARIAVLKAHKFPVLSNLSAVLGKLFAGPKLGEALKLAQWMRFEDASIPEEKVIERVSEVLS